MASKFFETPAFSAAAATAVAKWIAETSTLRKVLGAEPDHQEKVGGILAKLAAVENDMSGVIAPESMGPPAKESRTITVIDKMKLAMECPVCLKVPRQAPVRQCDNGHCVCSLCRPKLTNCPLCKGAFIKTRNLLFEQLLTEIHHACKFTEFGCKFEETMKPLQGHEQECKYRLVNCADLDCKRRVSLTDFLEHFTKTHEFDTRHLPCSSYLMVEEGHFQRYQSWVPSRINLDGKHFFAEFWRTADGLWHSFVYMVGSKEECENYQYTVRFFKEGKKKHGVTFCGPCVALDLNKEEVVEVGNCVTFSDTTAKRFWAYQEIHYEVTIEKEE